MKIESQKELEACIGKTGINLFLGAGFSVLAQNRAGETLCLGNELKEKAIERFSLVEYSEKSLSYICKKLKRSKKGELYRFLNEALSVHEYDKRYASIFKCNINNIISLNIDNLLEVLQIRESLDKPIVDSKIYGATESSTDTMLFKLHGSITYPATEEYYFTPEEIMSFPVMQPQLFNCLTYKLASAPTVFWGVNVDSEITKAFFIALRNLPGIQNHGFWVVVLPGAEHDADAEDLKEDGFNIIRATSEELLSYFENRNGCVSYDISELRKTGLKTDLQVTFKKNLISFIKCQKNPVRPISKFYQGDDAIWSDIEAGVIPKLSVYDKIKDKIEEGNGVHITGIPGAGKTTLMMQLAYNSYTGRDVYFFSSPQRNKMDLFLKKMPQNYSCIVFIDNIMDDIDSVKKLARDERVLLVTSERDHNLENVQSMINIKKEDLYNISDITERDIQTICDALHKSNVMGNSERLSLFEIVYNAYTGEKLDAKVADMIRDIKVQGEDLYQLYMLLTYVRYANVFATYDTLLAFFDEMDYKTILNYCNVLSSTINEYQDTVQDFMSLRSRKFAEASINVIDRADLGRFLLRFLRSVPFSMINRYDVFKKRAYDADLTTKAFPNVNDGIAFYNALIAMDDDAYSKQQFALYLSRRHYKDGAWRAIDDAYTQTHGRKYSINNTHAMILFENNIDKGDDDNHTVLQTLNETFEVLEHCIEKDHRKPYHVLTYVRHSLKYYERYRGSANVKAAQQYLEKSKDYLAKLDYTFTSRKENAELLAASRKLFELLETEFYGEK